MTALIFTLKTSLSFKLDCSRLTPDQLAGLTLQQIQNLSLFNQKNSPKVADFFEVSGDDAKHTQNKIAENIIFKNCNKKLDYIGHKMSHGTITIEGAAGDFLGAGMQGGTIVCRGSAGDRTGDQIRRGLILIDGDAGDYCASRMIAGTIGVHGEVGNYAGFAMKRGTLLLTKLPKLHATIQDCGAHTLPFLALLFRSFRPLPTLFNQIQTNRVQRFAGDLACNGNGEILVISS
ncbi:MAG: formylmethanofuran dehydrogenase subunit C [Methylotenera sp.]